MLSKENTVAVTGKGLNPAVRTVLLGRKIGEQESEFSRQQSLVVWKQVERDRKC